MVEDDRSHSSYSDAEDDARFPRGSHDDNDDDEDTGSYEEDDYGDVDAKDDAETIALFGVEGPTGHHFLRLALDAGYRVRALVTPGMQLAGEFEDLHVVSGTFDDGAKVQEVVYGSTYVVCMLGEVVFKKPIYDKDCLQKFVKTLYRLMRRQDDPVIKGFLFQATSLASDGRGKTPVLSKLMRKVSNKQKSTYLQDTDAAIKYICSQHKGEEKAAFSYIVTRPSFVLKDGPSTKKLAASKSQPGPFPCSNVDLAEFSLNALKVRKLFNSCPYVVGDGIY